MPKREVEIVIISDVHLGTFGCHAKEVLKYLKSIKPKTLILNGDIIDIWQFSKSYWPEMHMKVLRKIMKLVSQGVNVHYLTGNHDEMLRKFADFEMGTFKLQNKVVLNVDGKRAWIFHGDIFDITMQHSKWLAKLGAVGYDSLIVINTFVNFILTKFGREKMTFSKKIKGSVKNAVKFMNDFENTAASIAIEKKYDYVICGHIHHPEIKEIKNDQGSVTYLNSGDWVESLTALEYNKGRWEVFYYKPEDFTNIDVDTVGDDNENLDLKVDVKLLYQALMK
ncbi:UDP-2,3-diacylglucosamine diphosphatase [Solitalea koreensis]|uniref:UDP-2,3-diacylglucosamine pyrophosphatase LpxH n=1 Tax=Solitalea koreensis TaxID=543615 RepID=A0A521CMZ8_9SPHI|nr:UDP-2,3-diacylglucosamine diphosphatase [Solitalea koreensis]SMO60755.1 UDP-2,3-diacylglucosamine pyrophosphatase LpxH [Solitalea koreensis]